MKKIFSILAIAALCFTACNKDSKEDNNKKGGKDEGGEDTEYVAPITIDGDFSDWAKLDASKVINLNCASTATKTDLKSAKVYYDEYYMFIYVEFDFTPYDNAPESAVFNVMLNTDNDASTGGYSGDWNQGETPCIDLMCQGEMISGGEVCSYDPGLYKWSGEPNTDGWSWDDVSTSGFISGVGDKKAFEISVCREICPLGLMPDEVTVGLQILVNGWDSTGVLPNAESTDDNTAGKAPLLAVSAK